MSGPAGHPIFFEVTMKFLITGGAGYIGSTIASALEEAGHTPIIVDSLITGRKEFTENRIFYQADIADEAAITRIFTDHPDIQATVHCAALIVVPESVARPYDYYLDNVAKSLEFFHTLSKLGHGKVVFSSSASLYDVVPGFMVTEESPLKPSSPYARTKFMMEMILKDFCAAYGMKGIALRYFNPIGADPKMRSGLYVKAPTHILGKLVETAQGRQAEFQITGTQYTTRDGTGIRDYIHVWDLARAHVKALSEFDAVFERAGNPAENYLVINLGTGKGVTVKELVTAFEKVYGKEIKKIETDPRPGDVAGSFCNADTAKRLLGWTAELPIEAGIRDALKWDEKRVKMLGL
jgi:UDP-glucose 4-epimerase